MAVKVRGLVDTVDGEWHPVQKAVSNGETEKFVSNLEKKEKHTNHLRNQFWKWLSRGATDQILCLMRLDQCLHSYDSSPFLLNHHDRLAVVAILITLA